jgi:ElaB/YqjD/DUF883 family membrane-anchored ribosome-binding protein
MANTTSSATSASPSAADTLAAKANVAYQSASQTLRDQTDAVVRRIQPQIDAVTTYARNDPTKAILMSAAAGAALMGMVALLMRSGGSRPDFAELRDVRSARDARSSASSIATSTLATIREAAMDLAERARSVAQNAIDSTHQKAADALGASEKRAGDAVGSAQKRASQAADSVSETVADAWNSLRDQAAPVVDRLKPQLEAAANYARNEPARAALGIAAAGAVLIGLMALIRGSESDSF